MFVCFLNMAQAETDTSFVERVFEANQAYKNNQFQQAANNYIRLIENGHENGGERPKTNPVPVAARMADGPAVPRLAART